MYRLLILIFILCSPPLCVAKIVEMNNAEALTVAATLKANLSHCIATVENDLLTKRNGIHITQNNQKIVSDIHQPDIKVIDQDWRTYLLSLITNPIVAYMLLLLGIYGIFFELVNPGYVFPGVIGTLAMILALYALLLLPVNYAGFCLIILGIGFIIAEVFLPTYGSLGIGGTVAFIIGSIMLINTPTWYHIAWSVIWAMALVNIMIFIILLGSLVKARHQKVQNGLEVLLGAQGRALGDINLEGQAVIRGEIWSVRATRLIASGAPIKVMSVSGLVLNVEEKSASEGE